jgi:ERF superfamily
MSTPESQLPLAVKDDAQLVTGSMEPSVGQMLQMLIERGNPEQNINTLERIIALKERSDAKQAEREFFAAFASLQSEMPLIQAESAVPDKQGNVKYRFADFLTIMHAVRQPLIKHGFSVTFDTDLSADRVKVTCTLMHRGGHSRSNSHFAKVGSGPINASPAQADGAATTYAKRYALCSALNIVVEMDTDGREDARNEGGPIDFAQVETLREMVKDTGSDEAAFLRFAGAKTYEEIGSNRYPALFAALNKKAHK